MRRLEKPCGEMECERGSKAASCYPKLGCREQWAVGPTWEYSIEGIERYIAGRKMGRQSSERPKTGCMRKLGSSKEPRETGCRPPEEGKEWKRSEKRKWERKARKTAERRTGSVGTGRVVASKTVGIAESSRRTQVGTDRLV